MQNIFIIGYLSKDPIMRKTKDGEDLTNIQVKVKQRDKTYQTYSVSTYAGTAKACAQYLSNGRQVAVAGELSVVKKDGHTYLNIDSKNVEFLPAKDETSETSTPMVNDPGEGTPLNDWEDIKSSDYPF